MTGSKNHPQEMVGRTPWSAADAPVGLLALCMMLISLGRQGDEGVPRGPGGPPHHLPSQHGRSVFHENSRAEGPFKQTTKGDGLSHRLDNGSITSCGMDGGKLVDDGGIEPPTSALRTQRSPS